MSNKIEWVPKKNINYKSVNEYLHKSIELNKFTNNGPCVIELEKKIRIVLEIDDNKEVICVANGTVALWAVAAAIEFNKGHKLKWATQSFTFPPSAQGYLENAEIIDIDDEGGIDLTKVPDYIDGIIVTNVFGNLVNINKYEEWAKKSNKYLIFDNAATAYSKYNNINSCNFGNASTISLHHTKPIGFGEGGAIIIDKEFAFSLRRIINFGIDPTLSIPSELNKWHRYGSNYKMSDVAAAFILQYLENFDHIVKKHKELYQYAKENMPNVIKLYPHHSNNMPFVSCLAILTDKPELSRKIEQTLLQNNIYCRKYYTPLDSSVKANKLYNSILCISLTKDMYISDIDLIIRLIKSDLE